MPDLRLDHADPLPLYAQLERAIRAAIVTGWLRPGDKLPTVRQLAVDLRLNANTVARVYAELERGGVVQTRRGIGTFVRGVPKQLGRPNERALRVLTDGFLADAGALGFTIDDVIRHLQQRRSRKE